MQIFHIHLENRQALGVRVGTQLPGTASRRVKQEHARLLAGRYPAQPIMSYIPALSWSNSMRLSTLTGEAQWREKAAKDSDAFVSGKTPAIAEPYRLTSFSGAQAFADAASMTGNAAACALAQKVAEFILPQSPDEVIRFADFRGDSFKLAQLAAGRKDAEYIVFCGVHFMADSADILSA